MLNWADQAIWNPPPPLALWLIPLKLILEDQALMHPEPLPPLNQFFHELQVNPNPQLAWESHCS